MKRSCWLLISMGLASGCVLPDYDLDLGPRHATAGGPTSAGQSGSAGRSSLRGGSSGFDSSAAGSLSRASGGSTSDGGFAGAGFAGEVSTESVAGASMGGATTVGAAGQPSLGGTSASTSGGTLTAPLGGAVNTGGAAGARSSSIIFGGAAGSSVNSAAGQRTSSGSVAGAGASSVSGSHSGGTAVSGASGAAVAGAPVTGGAAGAAGSVVLPCPSGRGPDMVRVPEGYCIDKTEVTEGQYSAWIKTDPVATAATQIDVCSWNEDFVAYGMRGTDNLPITNVDWCDAVAFCKWANKRLCGAIGGGTLNYFTGFDDANESQWYNACSAHGAHVYPYGDTIADTRCNAGKAGLDTVAPVGAFNRCTSSTAGYTEIFDMSGNVWEWVDSCSGLEESDYCRVEGSSYYRNVSEGVDLDPRCAMPTYELRYMTFPNLGFRCCAD
ncbi:MAG TPA: SUMF1/EgtB/PvdO family nonheme iron enzyme [Polyangiaceae bacterium]